MHLGSGVVGGQRAGVASALMNYPPDFIKQLKERAGARCECERGGCHTSQGRCSETLTEDPGGQARWSPVLTGERLTFPPLALDYIALCGTCAVPRVGSGKAK